MKLLEDVNVYDPISSLLLGYNNAMFLFKSCSLGWSQIRWFLF